MDHPRLRGEHQQRCIQECTAEGSPPPTRGTPITPPCTMGCPGITPAYAGNTSKLFFAPGCMRDHPRLRGEHVPVCQTSVTSLGSPPPTRGTLSIREELVKDFRITPAYAGNTGKKYFTCFPSQDHPRLRGEHSHEHNQYFLTSGSPPPTRGTPV